MTLELGPGVYARVNPRSSGQSLMKQYIELVGMDVKTDMAGLSLSWRGCRMNPKRPIASVSVAVPPSLCSCLGVLTWCAQLGIRNNDQVKIRWSEKAEQSEAVVVKAALAIGKRKEAERKMQRDRDGA